MKDEMNGQDEKVIFGLIVNIMLLVRLISSFSS